MNKETSWWIPLAISLLSVAVTIGGQLIAWGKFIQKLNGMGERLGEVEQGQTKLEERTDGHTLQIQRIADRLDYQVQTMSAIDAKAQACLDAVDSHQRELISRFDNFLLKKSEDQVLIRERLAKIEQQLRGNNHYNE